jgi:hypothetical protein
MNKDTFELLIGISKDGELKFLGDTESNAEQRVSDNGLWNKTKYLISIGCITKIESNFYAVTEYGSMVSSFDSWDKYLEHLRILNQRSIERDKIDLSLSKLRKYTFWPIFVFALITSIYTAYKLTQEYQEANSEQTGINTNQTSETEPEQSTPHISPSDQRNLDSSSQSN